MTDTQIISEAIIRAHHMRWYPIDMPGFTSFKVKEPTIQKGWPWFLVRFSDDEGHEIEVNVERVLFDKAFARALWGEKEWQSNLQQHVVSRSPIAYLGVNL